MKTISVLSLAVVFAAVVFVVGVMGQKSDSAAAPDKTTSWQHLALTHDAAKGIGDAETSRQIVRLGAEGWELVDVESISKDGTTTKIVYFFKKPR